MHPQLQQAASAADRSATLRLAFSDPDSARACLLALTSLLSCNAPVPNTLDSTGRRRADRDLADIAPGVRSGQIIAVELSLPLPSGYFPLHLSLESAGTVLALNAPIAPDAPVTDLIWLQSDPDFPGPVPVLALPTGPAALTLTSLHALVGVAIRVGGFSHAALVVDADAAPVCQWHGSKPDDSARPIAPLEADTYWQPADQEADASAWFTIGDDHPGYAPLPSDWRTTLDTLVRSHFYGDALTQHLRQLIPAAPLWRLIELTGAPETTFTSPAETGTVLKLIPADTEVLVAVNPALPPDTLATALLHAAAHLALGHVRPSDTSGHWDTESTLTAASPFRRWDREVRDWLARNLPSPATRQVTSLKECSPQEKAWLVLHDHIGRMVGEARTLHPAAEHYQSAAYQRQAAQRLVAQLEDYSGAMLCDGVGLGKTYVSTTVLVHYANAWREQLASQDQSVADDPLRITILAPNSVVSTWQREAIPPLGAHGVPLASIRVLSHSKLSRILPSSDILQRHNSQPSDMEHLLLSDLVIVDEAHNFRSVGARRTTVLRDLLRLQPRRDRRRKVLLLTATPVNNSLEDLRQQAALMFSKPLWFNDNLTADGYRTRVFRDIEERLKKAGKAHNGDAAPILIHGSSEARFSYAPDFRDDLQFGVQVPRIGDYLKEQEKLLSAQQDAVRAAMQTNQAPPEHTVRVAGELLDRIVVQRSRALCKQIEREQGSDVKLLFRPDAPPPEKLVYEDVYDDTRDVLARFLPLFDTGDTDAPGTVPPLSLKVYMWADVRDGIRQADEVSSVVGLQRVLVLKRLESSPVAFLITLLRLLALHAHRLKQLSDLCHDLADRQRARALDQALTELLDQLQDIDRNRIDLLLTGAVSGLTGRALLKRWSQAHTSAKAAADADDPAPPQLSLLEPEGPTAAGRRDELDRLWGLQEDLTRDLATLLSTAPGLADIVFGRFAEADWPRAFINGGQSIDWPGSAGWAMRIVKDAKVRKLVARLLRARSDGQKVIVFSQFTDSLAYVKSVFSAIDALDRHDWSVVTGLLGTDAGCPVNEQDVRALMSRSAVVTGDTEDRDLAIHAFAPFYRLGPWQPRSVGMPHDEYLALHQQWQHGWTVALQQPIDVMFATDVLAEGVNLQDVALLINFDVHWNPVRMIQRAGRIDRRLNPAIEEAESFPDLEALAKELGLPAPTYWWHAHPGAAPAIVNLLLPDELEAELQLRERIANKTLAIDFTLGLEQGTGAEADWMADYRYRGISALNAWEGDRAIEQIAGYQQRLQRLMRERGIAPEWVQSWNGWLREAGADDTAPLLAWARIGRKGGELAEYSRQLTPKIVSEVPHWLWTTAKPGESMLNFWLALDSKTWPPATRNDLPYHDDASRPISADDLLHASRHLVDGSTELEELDKGIGRPVRQGASAIAAGYLNNETDRRDIQIAAFRILQLRRPTTGSDSITGKE